MISKERIFQIVSTELPAYKHSFTLESLNGGNLNHVWRLRARPRNLVIKWAPPHVASNPDIPLTDNRIRFEARALRLFHEWEQLHEPLSRTVRAPEIIHFSSKDRLLIMEDVGECPTLDRVMTTRSDDTSSCHHLGIFIGRLHKKTQNDPELFHEFNNIAIQESRLNVQYGSIGSYLDHINTNDLKLIEDAATELGKWLLKPGKCLIMGDLWFPSLIQCNGQIRIIDWEFVHYGQPLQDIAHFAAHCWMHAHASESRIVSERFKSCWNRFWSAYQSEINGSNASILDSQQHIGMAVHTGSELLMRTVGPFQSGFLYDDSTKKGRSKSEVIQLAVSLIKYKNWSELWDHC